MESITKLQQFIYSTVIIIIWLPRLKTSYGFSAIFSGLEFYFALFYFRLWSASKYDETSHLPLIRWKDTNIVTMATDYDSMTSVAKVKRWPTEVVSKIHPLTFQTFNVNMGGVDILDQCKSLPNWYSKQNMVVAAFYSYI